MIWLCISNLEMIASLVVLKLFPILDDGWVGHLIEDNSRFGKTVNRLFCDLAPIFHLFGELVIIKVPFIRPERSRKITIKNGQY